MAASSLAALLLTFAAAQTPLPVPLLSAEALEPGGASVMLSPGVEAIVDPSSSFRVVLPGRIDDARLSLLDGADALVPAIGMREVGEQTVLTVAPRKQLTPASRYLLRVDGVRVRDLHDTTGRAAGPVELHLVVAGSPPESEKKATKRKRR